jgi:trimethylamine-N-oxide reductase (cytochrome c)
MLGGYTWQTRNPDSWEGWYWGAKHVWGCEPVGKAAYQSNIVPDMAEHSGMLLFIGCDPETTTWGWGGQTVSQLMLLVYRAGNQTGVCLPGRELRYSVHADKWIPICLHDAGMIRHCLYRIVEDIYDKEYVDYVVGFDNRDQCDVRKMAS